MVINFHYIDGENTIGGVSFLFSFFFDPFVKSYLYMGRTKHELIVVLNYVRILIMSKWESTNKPRNFTLSTWKFDSSEPDVQVCIFENKTLWYIMKATKELKRRWI